MTEEIVHKIYLPIESRKKFLYGHKVIESGEAVGDAPSWTLISYFVIKSAAKTASDTSLELLGSYGEKSCDSNTINVIANASGVVTNVLLGGKTVPKNHRIILLNYDKSEFLQTFDYKYDPGAIREHFALFIAQAVKAEQAKKSKKSLENQLSDKLHNFLIAFTAIASKLLNPLALIFQNTIIHRHCQNWRQCLHDEHFKSGFIVFDVLLGIAFFLLMNHVGNSGRYFMSLAEFIVQKLQELLKMFDGSPAGLKLNVQLNNFLLSCFMYHVDLWWNFIVIVEPAIHYLFVPITAFGLMGFSFQCAMLCDVVTLITLHAHCFYIYAAMLYKLELTSIKSLLRIVLGRRLNVLKSELEINSELTIISNIYLFTDRTESQEYTSRQLFLATLFFTTLLFLLPTVIIYYLVFASVRSR